MEVAPGAIFGVLGPNGAGKTTLISIFATLLRADAGQARVLGLDIVTEAIRLGRGSTWPPAAPTSSGASAPKKICVSTAVFTALAAGF